MSEQLTFAVQAQGVSHAKTIVKTRNFEFIVDEPEALGGTNEAPNPVEYLLASYAGCLNVVAHIVAKEQKFFPKDLQISIEGNLDPNRLFGKSFQARAGYGNISVNLSTSTKLDEAQCLRWLREIEERCPVNDNLLNKTPIQIKINQNN